MNNSKHWIACVYSLNESNNLILMDSVSAGSKFKSYYDYNEVWAIVLCHCNDTKLPLSWNFIPNLDSSHLMLLKLSNGVKENMIESSKEYVWSPSRKSISVSNRKTCKLKINSDLKPKHIFYITD